MAKPWGDTITLTDWYKRFEKAAKKQGWSLWTQEDRNERTVVIQKIDDDDRLVSDVDAIDLVVRQAAQGCIMSLLALWWDGRPLPHKDNTQVWIPSTLRTGDRVR